LAARTGSGPMRMCGDIFAAARRWKSTISNAGRVSPLVLSSTPAVPFDSTSAWSGCAPRPSLPSAVGSCMVALCSTFAVPLTLPPCNTPLQEDVAPPSRRPVRQSIADSTAPCPCDTLQRPTGLCSPHQPPRCGASCALVLTLRLPSSYLAVPYPRGLFLPCAISYLAVPYPRRLFFSTGMFRMHFATLAHLLPSVWSHFHNSILL